MIKTGTALGPSYIDTKKPEKLEFSIMDQDEILKSSVCSLRNERIYE